MDTAGNMDRDGEALLGFLVPAAEKLLADPETEVIDPVAALLGPGEDVLPLPPATEGELPPDPEAAFGVLCRAVGRHAVSEPECRAAGVLAAVHVVREDIDLHTDAIRFYLETRGGEALNVFLPYRTNEKGAVETGEIFAVEAEPFLFSPRSPDSPEEGPADR